MGEVSNSNDNTNDNNTNTNTNESSTSSRKGGVSEELSSSVHQLLHDSSERTSRSQSQHAHTDSCTTLMSVPEGDITIFRTNETNERTTMDEIEKTRSSLDEDEEEESKLETPNQCVHISKLQR